MTGSQPVVLNRFTISASRDIIAVKDYLGNRWFCDMKENRIAVYLGKWGKEDTFPLSYVPEDRERQLLRMNNPRRKKEMEAVWSLLGYALKEEGLSPEKINLRLLPSGKWASDQLFFSLSHEGNYAAVALSTHPIGVDIVFRNDERLSDRLRKHISTPEEYSSEWSTAALFAAKEAIFKRDGGTAFVPSSINVLFENERVFANEFDGLVVAVASSDLLSPSVVDLHLPASIAWPM